MLLKLEPEQRRRVVELGMSHAGEIAALARIRSLKLVWSPMWRRSIWNSSLGGQRCRAKYELIESLPIAGTQC